jgi:hypothetical protein
MVTDRIRLRVFGSGCLKQALGRFTDYVKAETLAEQVDWAEAAGMKELEAGDEKWLVSIEKMKV